MKSVILTVAVFGLMFSATSLFAQSAPTITAYFLDNQSSSDVRFNPANSGTVEIKLEASLPVKFNTVAVCSVSDATCSRSTAVKYFTQASSFSPTFTRAWDGKNSSGSYIADGSYKVKATIKDESGAEASPELSSPLLLIDSSFSSGGSNNQNQLSNTDNSNNSGDSNDSDADNDSESGSSLSAHEAVSTANSAGLGTRKVSVNAGRKRLASVGAPVEFRAVTSGFRETDGSLELLWSFGDGAHAYGKVVRHIYALPGTYQVVLNANQADTNQAVSRTSVEVIKPEIKINQATPEFIELKNNSKQEVNLSFWKLKHHGQEFIFPIDTIIAANNSIKLPAGISYLRPDSVDMLTLAYPDGQLAIMPKVIPVADQSGTKNNQELAQVLNQVKLALQKKPNNHAQQILTQTQVRAVNQTAQVTQAIKSESDLQTVKIGEQNNQPSKKWWQKLFSL